MDQPGKFDEIVEQDGVKVVIDSKALFSIIGSEMDWKEDALRYVSCLVLSFRMYLMYPFLFLVAVRNSHSRIPISRTLVAVGNLSLLVHDRDPLRYLDTLIFLSFCTRTPTRPHTTPSTPLTLYQYRTIINTTLALLRRLITYLSYPHHACPLWHDFSSRRLMLFQHLGEGFPTVQCQN